MAAAHRANSQWRESACPSRALFQYHLHDLRYHVAGALQHHGIADTDILAGDFVFIVQCSARHENAADIHGCQHCHRRQCAGTANLDANIFQRGGGLFGREFPCRRTSAGSPPGKPQALLIIEIVDLINHAVDVVCQAGTLLADTGLERPPHRRAELSRAESDLTVKPHCFRRFK